MHDINIEKQNDITKLTIKGELNLHTLPNLQNILDKIDTKIVLDFSGLNYIDTAVGIYINNILNKKDIEILSKNRNIDKILELTKDIKNKNYEQKNRVSIFEQIGIKTEQFFVFLNELFFFIGELFIKKIKLLNFKNFRYKEILFEINQTGIKAIFIVALTSFLVGVVVSYQASVQLKLYGANIFIIDMIGISVLREMAPMITAIVIAGRSGSSFTAEIGAMKITDELDAMKSMGFDIYYFLIIPKILALIVVLPILIFVADIFGILGGMIVSNIELGISSSFFINRFNEVIGFEHFFIGLLKGPFFAFLISTIAIYRGLKVKEDTQSIGKNTTKSVVESIFAVIVCDALFSIIFTNLGI